MLISVSLITKIRDNHIYIYTILGEYVTRRNGYNKKRLTANTAGLTNITV